MPQTQTLQNKLLSTCWKTFFGKKRGCAQTFVGQMLHFQHKVLCERLYVLWVRGCLGDVGATATKINRICIGFLRTCIWAIRTQTSPTHLQHIPNTFSIILKQTPSIPKHFHCMGECCCIDFKRCRTSVHSRICHSNTKQMPTNEKSLRPKTLCQRKRTTKIQITAIPKHPQTSPACLGMFGNVLVFFSWISKWGPYCTNVLSWAP